MKNKNVKIYKEIQELNKLLRDEIRQNYGMVFSFDEAVTDRWEKVRCLGFAEAQIST